MAKIKRRKSSKLFSSPRKKTRGSKFNQMGLVNSGIAIMSLLLVAFIFSFSERQVQSGVPIEVKFPSMPDAPKLATEIYESNPLLDIQVEILNGCGTPGIAAKFSELLRDKRVDVVRSENADHFEYEKTVLIQRNEKIDAMKHVAQVLGFNIQNPEKVRTSIDPNLVDVDLTLIIGKDYPSISSIKFY